MRYFIALLFCFSLAAQQTVNNFTVKTNLVVGGMLTLSGDNVNNAIYGLSNPIDPYQSTNWLATSTWGDSLTAGTGGTPYPAVLQSISGTKVSNGGVGGETSTQIKTRMLAATNLYSQPTIIWAGRNNYSDTATVLADVSSMVSVLASVGNNKFLVLSVLNGSYGGYEAPGGLGYQQITNLNAQLSAAYGAKYVEVREYLVSLYNPSNPTDVADHAADRPPTSLRSDAIHLNSAGYSAVANYLYTNKWDQLRGQFGFAVTQGLLAEYLKQPLPIGSLVPNVGNFSEVYIGGTGSTPKFISLSGDSTSLQVNSKLIPLSDNVFDLGYDTSQFRWRNAYMSGTVYSPSATITNLNSSTGTFSTVNSTRVSSSSLYKEYRYNSNGGAGYGVGATYDLFSMGSYTKICNGVVLVRLWNASSRAIYTVNISMIGGGNAVASITPTMVQTYGGTALSGTFSLAANTPAAGDTALRFTNGANALTAIDYAWIPMYVEGGTAFSFNGSP